MFWGAAKSWETARELARTCPRPWEESRGWSRVGVSARGWGAAGGWSCGCSASLSRGPGIGVGLEQPQDHRHSPQSPTCPSQPGLGVPPPLPGLGGAPRTATCWECWWDPPSHRCAHLAACPVPAGGQTFKFSLPKSYHNSAVCPCTGNTILMNFPANFPASPSPASVCV